MCVIRSDMDDDVTMTRLETHANDEMKRRSVRGVVSHRKNAVYARRGHRSSRLVLCTHHLVNVPPPNPILSIMAIVVENDKHLSSSWIAPLRSR